MAGNWLRITATSPSEELTGLLAEGLLACGGTAIQEQGDRLTTYVPLADGADEIVASVREVLRAILGMDPLDLEAEHVPEQDWLALWRSGLAPRRVGGRIVVSPTWSEVDGTADDVVIRIDPQMAFGTGEHASTRGVLRLLQSLSLEGAYVLDVGSGSGILAIAAAMMGARQVVAVESDADAIENALENIDRNGVGDHVTQLHALVDDDFLDAYGGGAFDGILANVLSGVLKPLLPAFHSALAVDGWAILSGILVEEAESMRSAAEDAGFAVESEDHEEQWWTVTLRRL